MKNTRLENPKTHILLQSSPNRSTERFQCAGRTYSLSLLSLALYIGEKRNCLRTNCSERWWGKSEGKSLMGRPSVDGKISENIAVKEWDDVQLIYLDSSSVQKRATSNTAVGILIPQTSGVLLSS
jgi:hypothetical protein